MSCKRAPDLARALARLALSRGGPRDLGAVRDGHRRGRRACRASGLRRRRSACRRSSHAVAARLEIGA